MDLPIRASVIGSGHLIVASLLLLTLVVGVTESSAQVSTRISSISPDFAIANSPITITAELHQGESIDQVFLVFRPFGESQYQQMEMDLKGNSASVTLPSRVVIAPNVEYYIVLRDRNNKLETYPLSESPDPFNTPPSKTLLLPVRVEGQGDEQIIFLSPEPFSSIDPEDVVISVSLLRADSSVIRKATQMFLDGADVTQFVVFSDDILVLAPDNLGRPLPPGPHRVSVRLFDKSGNLANTATLTFTVQGGAMFAYSEPVSTKFKYGLTVNAESRHETVNDVGTWYNRGGFSLNGTLSDWRVKANLYLTSEEKSDRQPQNRYFFGVESPWLRAGVGDSYPSFPNLILEGKRVRGINAGLHLGGFNVDVAYGQTTRGVEGSLLTSFPKDSLAVQQSRNPSATYGPVPGDTTKWGTFAYGTYSKNLFAIRPSFGSGESFQWGFTYLHAGDDDQSITYGIRPDENVVVGTDLIGRLDERRIELRAQVALSAYNSDISSGTITDEYLRTSNIKDTASVKKVRDILGKIITVNDNLRPLSTDFSSVAAYEAGVVLRYFDNVFRFTYLYRGNDYNSAGQTYLRKDVQGFNLNDRMRVVGNQLFATLGYERLHDNTGGTKVATTTYSTLNAAVSYYPTADAPSITAGYSRFDNDNGLSTAGRDSLYAVSDVTNQIFLQSSYDFTAGARHTAALSLSTSSRDDKSLYQSDVKSTTIGLGLSTRYAIPLQTTLDLSFNLNELPGPTRGATTDLNYTTLVLRGRYAVLTDIFTVTAGINPSFGDFKRTVLDLGAEYYVLPTMSFSLSFAFFKNTSPVPDDNFISLKYRYDL
jgi:hypothetical protein